MTHTQALIAGAGPTGLVLALWLTRRGIAVRIVDKTSEAGTTSRALVVHARTMEFYRQLGLADAVLERAREFHAANLWVKGRRVGHIEFGEMGCGLSPFPFMLVYPQEKHERFLIERLAELGVTVERRTELVASVDDGQRVVARLKLSDGSEQTCTADYLAGCDGAHSTVRSVLGVGFGGSTYEHLFYVADVDATGEGINNQLHVAVDEADFVAIFPLRDSGHARLIGIVRQEPGETELTWEDVQKDSIERLQLTVNAVHWFSTYHVHHRVASEFRRGRVFLLGDAAHIHSPVGGQGMNTGIGDAVNLAWKLADVLQGKADATLLDSYEPERIAFAKRLVETTDRAFTFVTSTGWFARFVRTQIVPHVLPIATRFAAVRRFMFRTVSQIAIQYRSSPVSRGQAGEVYGGDRLPWVAFEDGSNNFNPLASLDWQVHVYGECSKELAEFCRDRGLALHTFPLGTVAEQAGLARGAAYLVRPDGYVGLADPAGSVAALARYLDALAIGGLGRPVADR